MSDQPRTVQCVVGGILMTGLVVLVEELRELGDGLCPQRRIKIRWLREKEERNGGEKHSGDTQADGRAVRGGLAGVPPNSS